jgi:hypothetical protein
MSERIVNVKEADYNGIHFRSSLEAQTAKTLDEMGIPYSYEERKLELFEGFRSPFQKDKVRSITYTPDFEIGPIMLECKGFETPEWKLKKKLLFKYLQENEPNTIFYQIHDARKSLLECLDSHWTYLGYAIQVTPKKKKNTISEPCMYDSLTQAMEELNLQGKPMGAILRSLTGQTEYVYGYSWKLIKIKL